MKARLFPVNLQDCCERSYWMPSGNCFQSVFFTIKMSLCEFLLLAPLSIILISSNLFIKISFHVNIAKESETENASPKYRIVAQTALENTGVYRNYISDYLKNLGVNSTAEIVRI